MTKKKQLAVVAGKDRLYIRKIEPHEDAPFVAELLAHEVGRDKLDWFVIEADENLVIEVV
jgi:hypothetical protein